jgi:hypothetical protein
MKGFSVALMSGLLGVVVLEPWSPATAWDMTREIDTTLCKQNPNSVNCLVSKPQGQARPKPPPAVEQPARSAQPKRIPKTTGKMVVEKKRIPRQTGRGASRT